jgi:hypothetical protein
MSGTTFLSAYDNHSLLYWSVALVILIPLCLIGLFLLAIILICFIICFLLLISICIKGKKTSNAISKFNKKYKVTRIPLLGNLNDYFFDKSDDDTIQCPVCMEEINSQTPIYALNCKHVVCTSCMQTFISKGCNFNCPLCRKNLVSNSMENIEI